MGAYAPVKIEYFSDVLCVWAYGAQIKLDELKRTFGMRIEVYHRYMPLFGDTAERIGNGWRERGGFAGFNRHVLEAAHAWGHVTIHPEVWLRNVPASSAPAHIFLKAIQHLEAEGELTAAHAAEHPSRSIAEEAAWRVRERFFAGAEDVASRLVQEHIARSLNLPAARLWEVVESGLAHGAAHRDVLAKERYQVPGSPCLVLNDGRQRLYGNIGYRIMEANVAELLHDPRHGEATWC